MSAPAPPARPRVFDSLRKATDRVPTKWFAGIGTALFLAVTAAFGGLAAVAPPKVTLDELAAGQEHVGTQLAVTVQRAVLIDALPGSGSFPEDGERLLVLIADVENRWNEPLQTSGSDGVQRTILLDDGSAADAIVREDDATLSPWLQPGVAAQLVLSWAVPADAYRDGEQLDITLQDSTRETGQLLFTGEYWSEPAPAAIVAATIEDVGAGSEGE